MLLPMGFLLLALCLLMEIVFSAPARGKTNGFTYLISACSDVERNGIETAIESAKFALNKAEYRTRRLVEAIKNPTPKVAGIDFSTLMAFGNIFGRVGRDTGVDAVAKLLTQIEDVKDALENPAYRVHMVCNDRHFVRNPSLGPNTWQDTRPPLWGGGRDHVVEPDSDGHICTMDTYAYYQPPAPPKYDKLIRRDVELIVFCPASLEPLPSHGSLKSEDLLETSKRPLLSENATIDTIFPGNVAALLLHELGHSELIFGDEFKSFDDYAYGYREVRRLSVSDITKAQANAESWAYYIIMMALDNCDWSAKVCKPMPPDFDFALQQLEYDEGWRIPEPKYRILANGRATPKGELRHNPFEDVHDPFEDPPNPFKDPSNPFEDPPNPFEDP